MQNLGSLACTVWAVEGGGTKMLLHILYSEETCSLIWLSGFGLGLGYKGLRDCYFGALIFCISNAHLNQIFVEPFPY